MVTEAQKDRLALAQGLRECADRSEQELRDALSRSYYSIYHVARAWVAGERTRIGHKELEAKVREKDQHLADDIDRLRKLRETADYDPDMVRRDFNGDLESFRLEVNKELQTSRGIYSRLCRKLEGDL